MYNIRKYIIYDSQFYFDFLSTISNLLVKMIILSNIIKIYQKIFCNKYDKEYLLSLLSYLFFITYIYICYIVFDNRHDSELIFLSEPR